MTTGSIRRALALGTALTLSMGVGAPVWAQATSGVGNGSQIGSGDAAPNTADPTGAAPQVDQGSVPTPGDRTGTATAAGTGQSAVTATNAPAPSQPALPRRGASGGSDNPADIIVTARRVEERLQDVPISITVFNQQQLNNRNVVTAADLATYTPSLSSNSNFGEENASFAIRGFVQDAGTPPSVGVYFADVVAPRAFTQGTQAGDSAGPASFFDLQNVQVLKGPQGTLQGRNTTGGAVLFVPQKPTGKFEGYVEGSYGNYDLHRIQGVLNAPLGDRARFRIAVDHQDRNGYLKNQSGIGPSNFNDINYTAVRASLVLDLTPDLENYTIASYSRSHTNGSVNKLIAANSAGYVVDPNNLVGSLSAGLANFIGVFSKSQLAKEQAQGYGFYDVEAALPTADSLISQWQVINTTTWRASDTITIKNIASYAQFIETQRSPLFGTNWTTASLPPLYQAAIFTRGIPALFTPINAAPGANSAAQATATEEIQLQGSALDDKLTYQGGFYFEDSTPLGPVGNQSSSLASCTNLATLQCSDPIGQTFTALEGFPIQVGAVNFTEGRTRSRDLGIYSQATYKLTDKLSFTGGVRYTSDRQSNTSVRETTQFTTSAPLNVASTRCTDPGQEPNCSEFLKQKSSKPTWLADVDFKPNEDMLIYAKYARGYRAGGVFANAPADHRTFSPEKVDAYEAGLKLTLRGPIRGTFNVDGFYNNFSNQQLQLGFQNNQCYQQIGGTCVPAPVSPTTGIVNAGKSRIYGAELESSLALFRGFVLDTSYTYLNATIRKIASFGTTDPLYTAANATVAPGSPLALSPKNKVVVTGTYTLPLDPSTVGRIYFGATFTHTDKQLTNYVYSTAADVAAYGGNFEYIPHTNLLNINVGWNSILGKPVDLNLFATNVTQKHYYTYIPGLGGLAGSGAEFAALGEPRFYGGRLRYRF